MTNISTRAKTGILVLAILTVMGIGASIATAGDQVENPKYAMWSHFKEGSSSTLSSDTNVMGNAVHMEITKTLVSLTPDSLVVENVIKANVMGHDHTQPAVKETITAKVDTDNFTPKGEQTVEAMGKTFKCKVWETTGKPTTRPAAGMGMGMGAGGAVKSTVYISDEVPGGVVKLESQTTTRTTTFVLSAMESK